jgi:hypothetical protein
MSSGPFELRAQHARLFDGIVPWQGHVPAGYDVDHLGALTDLNFIKLRGIDPSTRPAGHRISELPGIKHGDWYFEVCSCLAAVREASDKFVMMTLGAGFGRQAVAAYKAVQAINPVPCKLVVVEPEPTNMQFVRKHLADNGIDPSDHWLVQMAISDSNEVALFPIGAPGTGAHNCLSCNPQSERKIYLRMFIKGGQAEQALENLLLRNSTGYIREVSPGMGHPVEIKYVSCITMGDLLGPFDRVDFVEADLQMSEIVTFPGFMNEMNAKVRRVHVGTHGEDLHVAMRQLFAANGWDILFDFEPLKTHVTDLGSFETAHDGILMATNPRLAPAGAGA